MRSVETTSPDHDAPTPTRRVFGYARVSTAEQAKQDKTSLDEQRRKIRTKALGIGVQDPKIWADEVSGSIELRNRPQGGQLIAALKPGDTVVAARLDRMFRNMADAAVTADVFRDRGIDLILLDLGEDSVTAKNGSGMGRVFFHLVAVFADFERERIRERQLEAKQALRDRGFFPGGTPPFGFKVVKEGRMRRLVPDEREQEIKRAVKLAWDQNKPITRILREMYAAGYRNRKGGPIRSTEVYRWAREPGRTNISERTKALLARRKERGEQLGNPKIREVAPLGLAAILANRRQRAIEVRPRIEEAIAQGAGSYRRVADLLNLWGLASAQGSRWYGSSVRNAMIALDLKFPNKEQRRAQGIASPVFGPPLTERQTIALAREAHVLQERLSKPRLGKAQKQAPEILQLSGQGYPAERIARVLGLSESSVGGILRAAGRGRLRGHRTASVEQRNARILAARLRGLNAPQIAREVGTTETIVYATVEKAAELDPGYAFGRRRLTPEEIERISAWQSEGIPVRVMAHRLERGVKTIYRVITTLEPPASP